MTRTETLRVVLDAMGGDSGPDVNVEGAVAAAREFGASVILVGVEEEVRRHLQRHDAQGLSLTLCHAPEAVEMGESPLAALRHKKQSSIRIGLELIKRG